MNAPLMILEIAVVLLGLVILLADLWTPSSQKQSLGYIAAAAVGLILLGSFFIEAPQARYACERMYVMDDLALKGVHGS